VHEKDRHVAAAAYKLSQVEWPGIPVALVTNNLKDFPLQAFEGTQIVRFSPAEYLDALFNEESTQVLAVIEGGRKKLKGKRPALPSSSVNSGWFRLPNREQIVDVAVAAGR
jgi:hypothetical protein